jgi:hypothetical protein
MTWTKLSDDFNDDTDTLSDAAFRLHVEGLVWSNKKLLDVRIPKTDLRRFAKSDESVGELVDGGWWEDDGDAYVILHHAVYQRLREAVIRQQSVNRENRAKRGKTTPPAREVRFKNGSSNDSSHDSSNGSSNGHDSLNEMDRPGRDEEALGVAFNEKTGEVREEQNSTPRTVSSWEVASIPTGKACRVCLSPVRADSPIDVCTRQDESHAAARKSVA